jgi:hypothetical protein
VWKTENPKQQSVFFKVYPKERSERLLSKDSVGFMTTISSHFGFLTPSPLMGEGWDEGENPFLKPSLREVQPPFG